MFPGSPATQPRCDSRGHLSRSVSWIAVSNLPFDTNFIGVRHARVEPQCTHSASRVSRTSEVANGGLSKTGFDAFSHGLGGEEQLGASHVEMCTGTQSLRP